MKDTDTVGPAIDPSEAMRLAYQRGRNEALYELRAALPQSLEQAESGAHASLIRWRAMSTIALAAVQAFNEHDKLGGAVRARCVADLMTEQRDENEVLVRKALAASAAKDAASDHPVYVEHKLRLHALTVAKDDAQLAADEAVQTLENAREYLRAWIARTKADTAATITNVAQPLGEFLRDRGHYLHESSATARSEVGAGG